jgi:hypothetical protein
MKHRRQSLPLVLEEIITALAQRVPEQDGSLHEVDAYCAAPADACHGRIGFVFAAPNAVSNASFTRVP